MVRATHGLQLPATGCPALLPCISKDPAGVACMLQLSYRHHYLHLTVSDWSVAHLIHRRAHHPSCCCRVGTAGRQHWCHLESSGHWGMVGISFQLCQQHTLSDGSCGLLGGWPVGACCWCCLVWLQLWLLLKIAKPVFQRVWLL
jgi:hypothetical protein